MIAEDPLTIYVGAASGGVWKSTDGGVTYEPIFDDHIQSIGAIKIDFAKPAQARFTLFNTMGQQLEVLKEGKFTRGTHHVYFDASSLPAGIYYINVDSDQGNFTEKVIVS